MRICMVRCWTIILVASFFKRRLGNVTARWTVLPRGDRTPLAMEVLQHDLDMVTMETCFRPVTIRLLSLHCRGRWSQLVSVKHKGLSDTARWIVLSGYRLPEVEAHSRWSGQEGQTGVCVFPTSTYWGLRFKGIPKLFATCFPLAFSAGFL